MRSAETGVLWGLAVLWLIPAGCSRDGSRPDSGVHTCRTDEDCPVGMYCDDELCVTPGDPDAGPDAGDPGPGADDGAGPDEDGGADPGADLDPDAIPCDDDLDCLPDRVCSFRRGNHHVATVCLPPSPGGAPPGTPCTRPDECANYLCACGEHLCQGEQGVCSAVCDGPDDCLAGYRCGTLRIADLAGDEHGIFACTPDQGACRRQADCPDGTCCQAQVGTDAILTHCNQDCAGEPDAGEACAGHQDCYAGWCFDYPAYCVAMCVDDGDCPVFDTGTACVDDGDCELGHLCLDDRCQRAFACRTMAFWLSSDGAGQPVYDIIRLCLPRRRTCEVDDDCREGEACKLYENAAATAVELQCAPSGPGYGRLGQPCDDGCFSDLCLGSAADSYCSRTCRSNLDCAPTDTYTCGNLEVEVRQGHSSTVPVCMRK